MFLSHIFLSQVPLSAFLISSFRFLPVRTSCRSIRSCESTGGPRNPCRAGARRSGQLNQPHEILPRENARTAARWSRSRNDLECADLSALSGDGTCPAAPGDRSPGGKAATSRRSPKSSRRSMMCTLNILFGTWVERATSPSSVATRRRMHRRAGSPPGQASGLFHPGYHPEQGCQTNWKTIVLISAIFAFSCGCHRRFRS